MSRGSPEVDGAAGNCHLHRLAEVLMESVAWRWRSWFREPLDIVSFLFALVALYRLAG
jgi:hypothetical protein